MPTPELERPVLPSERLPPSPPGVPPGGGRRDREERIKLSVKFEGAENSLSRVLGSLAAIERSVVDPQAELVSQIVAEALGLSADVQRHALRRYAREQLGSGLIGARTGSVLLELDLPTVGWAVCVFVLQKTLGTSFSDAWKQSEAGRRITENLRNAFDLRWGKRNRREEILAALQSRRRFGTIDVKSLTSDERDAIELVLEDKRPIQRASAE